MAATTIVKTKTGRNHLPVAKAKEAKAIHAKSVKENAKKGVFERRLF